MSLKAVAAIKVLEMGGRNERDKKPGAVIVCPSLNKYIISSVEKMNWVLYSRDSFELKDNNYGSNCRKSLYFSLFLLSELIYNGVSGSGLVQGDKQGMGLEQHGGVWVRVGLVRTGVRGWLWTVHSLVCTFLTQWSWDLQSLGLLPTFK